MQKQLVIVSGTSGGLGAGIARNLTTSGFHVIGISRRSVDPASICGDDDAYIHISQDLGEIDQLGDLVKDIVDNHGKPFALINNAALGTDGVLPTMHNSDIETLVRVNVTSPIVLTKYIVRHMLAARQGRVVNISSIVAQTGYRGLAAYGATKASMEGFTRSLARELGPREITVNTVSPGFLETDMTSGLGDKNLDRIRSRSALSRFAFVEEVAAAVGFLLTDAAAGITGTTITVDAGSTA